MAFIAHNINTLAYADGFTLWTYCTEDERDAIVAGPGYFGRAADMLRRGDMILTNYAGGATILSVVSTQDGVTVADLTNRADPQGES